MSQKDQRLGSPTGVYRKLRAGGRILDYGGSIIPLEWRECAQTISSLKIEVIPIREKPISKVFPFLYLSFHVTVMFIATIARYLHLLIPPIVWALVWATGITVSLIAY